MLTVLLLLDYMYMQFLRNDGGHVLRALGEVIGSFIVIF